MGHACAATEVEANTPENTTQTTLFESPGPLKKKKNILKIITVNDTKSQLAKPRHAVGCPKWMVGMGRRHAFRPLLVPPHPWFRRQKALIHLRAKTNTFLTQDNLVRWGQSLQRSRSCSLSTLCLTSNPSSHSELLKLQCGAGVTQSRFTWRHDTVLYANHYSTT